jgi:peptidoglycan hydrolase FlgJ
MQINARTDSAPPLAESRLQPSPKGGHPGETNPVAAKKVAREFEAMFIAQMLKSMRETVGKDTLTGGGRGEETFRSLLDQEYAAEASRTGGIGLARVIEQQLIRPDAQPAPMREVNHAD